jgi:hypothetical protein
MEMWKKYLDDANGYSKAAFGAFNKDKLGSQVVYNLLSMGIENYLTALCISGGEMPEHEGISFMLRQVGKKIEIPEAFFQEARFLNRFMNFCSLEVFEPNDPSRSDLVRMLGFTDELKRFCEEKLLQEAAV